MVNDMEIEELNKLKTIIDELIHDQLEVINSTTDEETKNKSQINLNVYKSLFNALKDDVSIESLDKLVVVYNREYNKNLLAYENLKGMKSSVLNTNINNYQYNAQVYKSVRDILSNFLSYISTITVTSSNDIISKISKYNSTNDENLLKEIYEAKMGRRKSLVLKFGEDIIDKLNSLESLEGRIAVTNLEHEKSYPINKNEFESVLKDTIKAINEYHFINYKNSNYYVVNENLSELENERVFLNRYKAYLRKFSNIISSIYKNNYTILNYDGNKISTDNLISYLSLYNLDGDYEEFKLSTKNKKINNKNLTKSEYNYEIKFIKNCINALCKDSISKIKDNYILINDNLDDRVDLISKRNNLIDIINKTERNDIYVHGR